MGGGRAAGRLVASALAVALFGAIGLVPAQADQPKPLPKLFIYLTAHGPNPRNLRAFTDQEIIFRNQDGVDRRVISLDGLFESPTLTAATGSNRHGSQGSSDVSVIFDEPAVYGYRVSGRPRQTGTIAVRDAPGHVRTPTPTPTPRRRTVRR